MEMKTGLTNPKAANKIKHQIRLKLKKSFEWASEFKRVIDQQKSFKKQSLEAEA
jgi:hypothetical protein